MPILNRFQTDDNGTFGKLYSETGNFLCYTVERATDGDHPCIPADTYQVEPYFSPTKGDVWQVMNVPGRSNIEIHPANLASQLLGCIAPGLHMGDIGGVPAVLNSQQAFAMLKSTLPSSWTLTITESYEAS
jgi:uncharacterized protein DUF5675